jgi:hypothetical protein
LRTANSEIGKREKKNQDSPAAVSIRAHSHLDEGIEIYPAVYPNAQQRQGQEEGGEDEERSKENLPS